MTRKMPDLISRDAAKELIRGLIAECREQLIAEDDGFLQRSIRDRSRGLTRAMLAIDAIPAAEPDNRWELLQQGIRELGAKWGSRGLNERTFGIEPEYSPSAICREELNVLMRSLSAGNPNP